MIDESNVLERVRRALGRTETPAEPPVPPPAIDDRSHGSFTPTAGLPELFVKRAAELKMIVTPVTSGSRGGAWSSSFAASRGSGRSRCPIRRSSERLKLREAIASGRV